MMKRILLIVSTILLLAGCAQEFIEVPQESQVIVVDAEAPTFYASITGEATKTYYGSDSKLHWTANDLVSVFNASTSNQEYVFTGQTGDRGGELMKVAGKESSSGDAVAANYAAFPYDESTTLSKDGLLGLCLPAVQTYSVGSFGSQSNTMVAVTESGEDRDFKFKNVGGYLVVKLYGDATIKSVTLSGNNGEKLSGSATVSTEYGKVPVVTMSEGASESIRLDCGNGVTLGKDASSATEFWFVVPPVRFTNGITVLVTDIEGKTFSKFTTSASSISRNVISKTEPLGVITKTGAFVRTLCDAQIYDEAVVTDIIYDKAGDNIPGGIIGKMLVNAATEIITQNGDLVVNRLVYTTKDIYGNTVEASGIVSYPKTMSTFSKILSVQHATCDYDEAPSLSDVPIEMAAAFKKGNQVVVMSDYLGYGVSQTADLKQPYMHSDVTGNACADLIYAAEQFLMEHEKKTESSKVTIDLIGYSQGGAATISTLLELEKRGRGSQINEVRAGSGPYDLSKFLENSIAHSDQKFHYSGYLVLTIFGLEYAEHLNIDYKNIFHQNVFDNNVLQRLKTTRLSSWYSVLGEDMTKILNPVFFSGDDYKSVPDIKILLDAMQKNSTVNRVPANASKITLYHGKKDNTVPYYCAESAKAAWKCDLEDLEKEDHTDCGIEFYIKYVAPSLWTLVKGVF